MQIMFKSNYQIIQYYQTSLNYPYKMYYQRILLMETVYISEHSIILIDEWNRIHNEYDVHGQLLKHSYNLESWYYHYIYLNQDIT